MCIIYYNIVICRLLMCTAERHTSPRSLVYLPKLDMFLCQYIPLGNCGKKIILFVNKKIRTFAQISASYCTYLQVFFSKDAKFITNSLFVFCFITIITHVIFVL